MKIEIPYGKTGVTLNIPDANLEYLISDDIKRIEKIDEKDIIKRALSDPVNSQKLKDLARGKKNAVVIVSDISRPCPSYKFLPDIIDELNAGGVIDIKVVFGLGIHRNHTWDEQVRLAGDYAAARAKLIDSDRSKCKLLGYTSYNTPVEIFEEVADAGMVVATGNIEYHYFAGYSGGAKAIMPGVSSHSAISNNHSYMLKEESVAGNHVTNPIRADIEEAGRMLGIDFIFNVILDDKKNIIDAVCGKNDNAFLEGIKKYDAIFKKEIELRSDIIIASPGGYPKDINLYQSHKALENVKDIVKKNGAIILVAQCGEGFGEDIFEEWMYKAKDYPVLKQKIEKCFVLGGHKAVAISKILSNNDVLLFSDFDEKTSNSIGFQKITDLQAYLDNLIKNRKELKITVVPSGRLTRIRKP